MMVKSAKQGHGGKHFNAPLVDQLWNLKRLCELEFRQHIPLNKVLNDPAYREDLLKKALQHNNPELTRLVSEIRLLEDGLVSANKPGHSSQTSAASAPGCWLKLTPLSSLTLVLLVFLSGYLLRSALPMDAGRVLPYQGLVPQQIAADVTPAAAPLMSTDRPLFRLHGSNTVGENLAPRLVEAYLAEKGAVNINTEVGSNPVEKKVSGELDGQRIYVEIHAHGSSTAFADLLQAQADIGMSSRRIKAQERDSLQPVVGDLSASGSEHVIGLDGLAIITHPGNEIASLSLAQLVAVFSGRITNWSQLGGKDRAITLYARDENSGTWDTFKSLLLDANHASLLATAKRFESSTRLADAVSKDPGGIGFIGLPYVRQARLLAVSESDQHLAIIPTHFTVGTEDYPLSRRLYLYTPQTNANLFAQEFANFSSRESAQEIVEAMGLVSQNIRAGKPFSKEFYPPLLRDLTTHSERLSINFRFKSGSDEMDNKSLRDLERLVKYMEAQAPRRAQLFGFSDSEGDDLSSEKLSLRRAKVVEQALIARGVYPLLTKGLGDAAPLASSDSELGRNINRRVEVWVL